MGQAEERAKRIAEVLTTPLEFFRPEEQPLASSGGEGQAHPRIREMGHRDRPGSGSPGYGDRDSGEGSQVSLKEVASVEQLRNQLRAELLAKGYPPESVELGLQQAESWLHKTLGLLVWESPEDREKKFIASYRAAVEQVGEPWIKGSLRYLLEEEPF